MKISLIIAFYKKTALLSLVFKALARQSYQNFEIVVAEDDSAPETLKFLEEQRKRHHFPILHVSQEDKGFRKNRILNKAIQHASGEFLVFIDGDCIPHKHFIRSYVRAAKENVALFGKRVKVSDTLTQKLLKTGNLQLLNVLQLLAHGSKRIEEALYMPLFARSKVRGILGCNWGTYKKHLLAINGFDEDYELPGIGEDVDIEWRLKASGITLKSMKNKAIIYHLYHPTNYTDINVNTALMQEKQTKNQVVCINGIDKKQAI